MRTQLATVQGAVMPTPYGGKTRQVMVDIDSRALQSKQLSPVDVVSALNQQNLILPTGTVKIGSLEYDVALNGSPKTIAEINDLPIRTVQGNTISIRDVAHVRDGFLPQTNIVRHDGQRAILLTILKYGNASTLDIVNRVRAELPRIQASMPPELEMQVALDQSLFVRAAVEGVVEEAILAGCLTALMILLFLGSWRSTLIIAVSIPLAIITSIITLSALGRDDQYHDAGRSGAGGRYPGRRRHGCDREHQPASRAGQTVGAGDSGWRTADRRTDFRVDPVDLYRVRADVPAHRRGTSSVRAAG